MKYEAELRREDRACSFRADGVGGKSRGAQMHVGSKQKHAHF
eukprot:gene26851-biopygen17438